MIHTLLRKFFVFALLIGSTGSLAVEVTGGVAPGYVADQSCRDCHTDHYDSYQHVGMSQSFKRPENARPIERFGETFFHEASHRYYEINTDANGMTFRRFQRDSAGNVINDISLPVDWVLGSGNKTRSYIYQNPHGEMFQLPLGWYSEGSQWEMAPGYETAEHDGLSRRITRECMFCHNAYPETDTDQYAMADVFPATLPEGTGCQRCHGPGGKHVQLAGQSNDLAAIRRAITNPAKLAPEARDSVCLQCHLLAAISLVGARQFGRGDYSFRPGELLSDYLVHLDIREYGQAEPERFEINHHGYRLLKSECYQKSEGALGCISCHNPHVKPDSAAFKEQVAGVCSDCHSESESLHAPFPAIDFSTIEKTACVDCHMPQRRTTDVIHVTMTDHWIARGPFDLEALVAPLEPATRPISSVKVLEFANPPQGDDAQAHIALGAMRAGRSLQEASASLIQVLKSREYDHYTPYLDLARAALAQGNYAVAEAGARGLVTVDPTLYVAHTLMGVALMAQGRFQAAIIAFKKSLALYSDPETHFNLAAVYFNTGQLTLTELELDKAIRLRPTLGAAYRMQGQLKLAINQPGPAITLLEQALKMDPGDTGSYRLIIESLEMTGDKAGAARWLELGQRAARQPRQLKGSS